MTKVCFTGSENPTPWVQTDCERQNEEPWVQTIVSGYDSQYAGGSGTCDITEVQDFSG